MDIRIGKIKSYTLLGARVEGLTIKEQGSRERINIVHYLEDSPNAGYSANGVSVREPRVAGDVIIDLVTGDFLKGTGRSIERTVIEGVDFIESVIADVVSGMGA